MENEVQNTTAVPAEKKGLSIASMVLGIVGLVCCCIAWISIPCSILAIIFGFIGKKKGGKGMATTGIVLGIIAVALYALLALLGAGLIAGTASAIDSMM